VTVTLGDDDVLTLIVPILYSLWKTTKMKESISIKFNSEIKWDKRQTDGKTKDKKKVIVNYYQK
jgi:hypothetical protein